MHQDHDTQVTSDRETTRKVHVSWDVRGDQLAIRRVAAAGGSAAPSAREESITDTRADTWVEIAPELLEPEEGEATETDLEAIFDDPCRRAWAPGGAPAVDRE